MSDGGPEGGCTCGQVRYRLTRDPIFVNCCHCRTCQALSGSAFALNIMIEADAVALTAGDDPERGDRGGAAAREAPVAYDRCGTALWGYIPMFGESVRFVRAGTLDRSELVTPDAHFFVRSKHPWITIPDGVPAYEALPTAADPPLWDDRARARLRAATSRAGGSSAK